MPGLDRTVFILYFQQATHVRPRPSLIVFDTYAYRMDEKQQIHSSFYPSLSSSLQQRFPGRHFSSVLCALFPFAAHVDILLQRLCNRLPDTGETNHHRIFVSRLILFMTPLESVIRWYNMRFHRRLYMRCCEK